VIYNRGWIPFRSRRAERTATRRSRGGVENPAMHHFELIIASEGDDDDDDDDDDDSPLSLGKRIPERIP
jgi:hypothetical protein